MSDYDPNSEECKTCDDRVRCKAHFNNVATGIDIIANASMDTPASYKVTLIDPLVAAAQDRIFNDLIESGALPKDASRATNIASGPITVVVAAAFAKGMECHELELLAE